MTDQIKQIIESSVENCTAIVLDPNNDGQHFQAFVISATFENISLVKQHQAVMKPLKEQFEGAVHALALKTFTPEKWEQQKQNFGF